MGGAGGLLVLAFTPRNCWLGTSSLLQREEIPAWTRLPRGLSCEHFTKTSFPFLLVKIVKTRFLCPLLTAAWAGLCLHLATCLGSCLLFFLNSCHAHIHMPVTAMLAFHVALPGVCLFFKLG